MFYKIIEKKLFMPELPEVQTIVNDLQKIISDTIIGFWSDFKKAISVKINNEDFEKIVTHKKIINIFRNGKNIIIELEKKYFIIIHLKMTGQLLLSQNFQFPASGFQIPKQNKYDKHVHHIFKFKKNGELKFSDIRKFATLEIVDEKIFKEKSEQKGLDPFSKKYTLKNFTTLINKNSKKNLKQFLMNQSIISGIGNIYASEIPFDAKISPLRKINSLSELEIKELFNSIKKILQKAIKLRGTSFSDYRDSSGEKGSFQNFLKVYKRNSQKCKNCDTIIKKVAVEQRSTFYCSHCQK